MIKIAFIKYGGLASSGTEKFLQNIAILLPKDEFKVDYYYCDATPYIGSDFKHPDTDILNIKPMLDNGVNLIKFKVEAKDTTKRTHPWINNNFFEVFKNKYDLIQTGRAGNPEYPFNKIKHIPIIDSIHIMGGIDNQFNISRVMHITKWSADKWIKKGGDKNRVRTVSHPMIINEGESFSLKKELDLENKIVFGFHQRNSDEIFSNIPLSAYKEIESEDTHFIILGGSNLYQKQAQDLNIKNITFLPHTGDKNKIYSFLKTLDVYAHGRKDGEINSTAMAEAMFFGKPIISHTSKIHNGHIECVGDAGLVVNNVSEFVEGLKMFLNRDLINKKSELAKLQFKKLYEANGQMENIIEIYKEAISNPYPNKIVRFISSFRVKFYIFKILEKLKNI
jgi:glycosyltransferase involved in cell wall biosynthesis